ncbi:MAG TPA: tRNA lysidine(34) synthetase TilS [Burkholderiales bacterium]|nr:tRNA lysidine(34) synthetase TilS [Burkholderiales bacterium]
MASSGKPKRSSATRAGLLSHVRAQISTVVKRGARVRVGVSGGVDSIVLLDLLARLAPRMGFELEALHVDHQLSANSRAWARFCRQACTSLGVPCRVARVRIARSNSIERAARDARYAALLATRADYVALAHNADDQAETVLLQLFRGSGVRGLAAMPLVREIAAQGRGRGATIVRPLIGTARAEIERYARRRGLAWIEDESNLDTRYTRNWLRREVLPVIAQRVPGYRDVLVRAAFNAAEAAELTDELARIDLERTRANGGVSAGALRHLTFARAKNVLRHVIAERGWRTPDSARLSEALRQALAARRDARVSVDLGSCELKRHGDSIHLVEAAEASREDLFVTWRGERELALPALDGVLRMTRGRGRGLSAVRLAHAPVTIRRRRGGERLQPDPRRPRRTVKNLLQEAGMPHWERERLPFIYCGETLACVPGIGVDHRFRAQPSEPGIEPVWTVRSARRVPT